MSLEHAAPALQICRSTSVSVRMPTTFPPSTTGREPTLSSSMMRAASTTSALAGTLMTGEDMTSFTGTALRMMSTAIVPTSFSTRGAKRWWRTSRSVTIPMRPPWALTTGRARTRAPCIRDTASRQESLAPIVTTFRLINSLTRMAASLDGVITAGHEECNAGAMDRSHDFTPLAPGPGARMGHRRDGWGAARRGMVSAMATGERVTVLKSNPVFAGLPAKEIEALAGAARAETYRAREYVFLEGDPARWLCLVTSGRVKIVRHSRTGKDVVLDLLGPGGIFGGVAVMEQRPYPAAAQAVDAHTV